MVNRFKVEYDLSGFGFGVTRCNTMEDLERYLFTNPNDEYNLVSVQFVDGNFILVWELKKS